MREGLDIVRAIARAEGFEVDTDWRRGMAVAVLFRWEGQLKREVVRIQVHGTPTEITTEHQKLRRRLHQKLKLWRAAQERKP